ncbi:cytochrome P450 [Legionella clemsonensis]|uniref:Vitamin D(3) 25-hydroxylase n=1 Tax=Legionella clemsonensis TaxID=1867846 RepID=A0A222P5G5_9GAMM|nr:cytochrome P450 [Legionella clemsonensis]ASQ47063.1 Vitamin D(3) 25-hydroxylase [Legionella clemsonensis]
MDETTRNDWDPRDESVLQNQRSAYDKMREKCPVAHSDFMGWSLFHHQDITTVLSDPETFSNQSQFLAIPNGMDPPIHEQYRKALAPNFSKKQMASLEPQARKIARDLIDSIPFDEKTELMRSFVTPFAFKTLCAFLGWPEQQWEFLSGWADGNQQTAFNRDQTAGKALATLFSECVKTNLNKPRASFEFENNATDALLKTEVDGAKLDDEQIVSILRNWTAGHGTVAAGLSILLFHLAKDFSLQDRLRNDHKLIPQSIEEILRVDGPLVANRRVTTREVKIAERTIPQGENLSLMWIAANRDPYVFDEPNTTKLERDMKHSLVWGQGIHLCLGAPLARLEIRVVLEELLSQKKYFALAGENQKRANYPGNGFSALFLSDEHCVT